MNLSTSLGPLDPLCRLHDGRNYEALLPKSETLESGGMTLQVLDLATLIEVKADAGRAKDRLVLPILIALLRERGEA